MLKVFLDLTEARYQQRFLCRALNGQRHEQRESSLKDDEVGPQGRTATESKTQTHVLQQLGAETELAVTRRCLADVPLGDPSERPKRPSVRKAPGDLQ